MEALASGLPVITAQSAGGAEVVTTNCGFVLADPNDSAGIVNAMRCLVSRTDAEKLSAGAACRAVAEQHSWTSKAVQYVNLFEQLAGSPLTYEPASGSVQTH